MREQEALEYLDRVLPADVGFTLNHVTWASPRMNFSTGAAPARARPVRFQRSREWGVSISYSGAAGDYLDVAMDPSLARAVKVAVGKFLAWRLENAPHGAGTAA